MSNTSTRNVQIGFSGDVTLDVIQSALANDVSPAEAVLQSLLSGDNAITAPVVDAIVVTALTIIPPAGNLNIITLKGVNGDTGIPLHLTDPSSISLDSTFVSLVLNAADDITGVRLIWS